MAKKHWAASGTDIRKMAQAKMKQATDKHRTHLERVFLKSLRESFECYGPETLEELRLTDPKAYLYLIAKVAVTEHKEVKANVNVEGTIDVTTSNDLISQQIIKMLELKKSEPQIIEGEIIDVDNQSESGIQDS